LNEYDTTLKLLFQGSATGALLQLTGVAVERWLNVELPRVQTPRVDLLGETHDGELVHVEFQSHNDSAMAVRMAEYYLGIYRQLNRYPRQTVVYVGEERMRMTGKLESPAMSFSYRLVDIREVDGDVLINSPRVGDNILSVLTTLPNLEEGIRRILAKIAECEVPERQAALQQFLLIAGLRNLEETIEKEVRKVPIIYDIMENKVLGREYKRGIEEGVQQGIHQGELLVLRRQIQGRFGTLPGWADARLEGSSPSQLETIAVRLLDAISLEELFR
jgi:hypothetical protein